jgi:hypothetical protein
MVARILIGFFSLIWHEPIDDGESDYSEPFKKVVTGVFESLFKFRWVDILIIANDQDQECGDCD